MIQQASQVGQAVSPACEDESIAHSKFRKTSTHLVDPAGMQ
jgi:hypothetical protein